ncbi:MAG: HAD hydrolase-like protein [Candidatus Latescibacteria bacterium]|nr:HAD hydrolase-like protein [Candidatus Latescibacterota bacterium]
MTTPRRHTSLLLDIEGVLVRDKSCVPVPGAPDWFAGIIAGGTPHCLVSNNTTHPPAVLAAALGAAGFAVDEARLVTALGLGARLLSTWGKRRLLWLGVPGLESWWRDAGFDLVRDGDCDAVVLGANPALTIADLERALPALVDGGAELVALHRGLYFLDDTGRRRFGPGFYAAALEQAAAHPAVTIGKPQARIYRRALEIIGGAPQDTLFISDDPVAALVTAKRLGMGTAFVLSGKHADCGVLGRLDQDDWPDLVIDTLADLEPPAPVAAQEDTRP